jgi:hypothetical protein
MMTDQELAVFRPVVHGCDAQNDFDHRCSKRKTNCGLGGNKYPVFRFRDRLCKF